jgi:hypothetical protein
MSLVKQPQRRWLWNNAAFICTSSQPSFAAPASAATSDQQEGGDGSSSDDGRSSCAAFDPHGPDFKECNWTGLVETQGPEDAKLFSWPGEAAVGAGGQQPRRWVGGGGVPLAG